MTTRWDVGPVFTFEWLASTRRWQIYALRSGFVAMLLASLTVVWLAEVDGRSLPTIRAQAAVGQSFSCAIIGTQLVLVLLAAPAATAGAICLDKSRGTLTHLLITDLSSAEIVLGKLGARLVPTFAMVACVLPAMSLGTLLGGVDPRDLMGTFLISLGVAAFGSTLALTFSVWGHKTHEVLLVTYGVLLVWALGGPSTTLLRMATPWGRWVPNWFTESSPFWFAFANYFRPGAVGLWDQALFLVATLAASAGLAALSVARLRPVAARQAGEAPRGKKPGEARPMRRLLEEWTGPQLDPNPVLWREWHRRRPTRWGRVLWASFTIASIGVAMTMVSGIVWGNQFQSAMSTILLGGQVAIGFLFLSVAAGTSLAEERARGSLDVLLATPMSTLSIVWGKWRGTYRGTILLSVLPGLLGSLLALRHGRPLGAVLAVGLVLAYGAALTSLGLAIATVVPRLGRAIALTVTAHVLVTIGWFFLAMMLTQRMPGVTSPGLASASPFIGTIFPLIEMQEPARAAQHWWECIVWLTFWMAVYATAALVLFFWTVSIFDRCLERVSERLYGEDIPMARARSRPISARAVAVVVED